MIPTGENSRVASYAPEAKALESLRFVRSLQLRALT